MKIKDIVEKNVKGLHFNNRIMLPFHAHVLKLILNDDIYTDFSIYSKDIFINEEGDFMNIYFREIRNLDDEVSKFESVKMVAVEKGENIFDRENHLKIALFPEDNHYLKIEFIGDDVLLIE